MAMEQTWRWYGPMDRISLQDIRQAGATGVVTALHEIPNGKMWPVESIMERKTLIEKAGLVWSVVESVPVHEAIKKQSQGFKGFIENYKKTIKNLGQCGIKTICYNFMPVLDWSRTDLSFSFPDGSQALKYEQKHFAAFELFLLKREGARNDYPVHVQAEAELWFNQLSASEKKKLEDTVIKGLPGAEESYSIADLREIIEDYKLIDSKQLKANLFYFLNQIILVAE